MQDFMLNNTNKGFVTTALFFDVNKFLILLAMSFLSSNLTVLELKVVNWFVSYPNNSVQVVDIGQTLSNFQTQYA